MDEQKLIETGDEPEGRKKNIKLLRLDAKKQARIVCSREENKDAIEDMANAFRKFFAALENGADLIATDELEGDDNDR